ncbi:disulfide isomerase DsbC N-terminal domain-containing protein [Burkholderia cepacia]|uniref:disulfide isomerase DsbC N-terminal domain-containing protein n=1 Tax=Burkholderia cepacia TaxID=292 RepID=UPI00398E6A76
MPGNSKLQAALLLATVLAVMHSASFAAQEAKSKQVLQEKIPELKIEGVRKSPITGLYEVIGNSRVFYSDQMGRRVILELARQFHPLHR